MRAAVLAMIFAACRAPLAAPPPPAPIAKPAPPAPAIEMDGEQLVVSFELSGILDAKSKKWISNGRYVEVVTRVYLLDGEAVIAATAIGCRVTYDVWREVFSIERLHGGTVPVLRSLHAVDRRCGSARRYPLASIGAVQRQHPYLLVVIAETNPLHPTYESLHKAVAVGQPLGELLAPPNVPTNGVVTARWERKVSLP